MWKQTRWLLLGRLPTNDGQLWNDLRNNPRHLHRHCQLPSLLRNHLLEEQYDESKVLPVGPLSLRPGHHVRDDPPDYNSHCPSGGGRWFREIFQREAAVQDGPLLDHLQRQRLLLQFRRAQHWAHVRCEVAKKLQWQGLPLLSFPNSHWNASENSILSLFQIKVTPKTRCYILLSWLLAFIPALPFLFDTVTKFKLMQYHPHKFIQQIWSFWSEKCLTFRHLRIVPSAAPPAGWLLTMWVPIICPLVSLNSSFLSEGSKGRWAITVAPKI